uniref:Uncharacterized protein n=1 Tax=Setaria italica TaxID=4555 RepID=K3XNC7_SETIT
MMTPDGRACMCLRRHRMGEYSTVRGCGVWSGVYGHGDDGGAFMAVNLMVSCLMALSLPWSCTSSRNSCKSTCMHTPSVTLVVWWHYPPIRASLRNFAPRLYQRENFGKLCALV